MQSSQHQQRQYEPLGARVDYHLWATGVPTTQRNMPAPLRAPKAEQLWEPQPDAWFQRYQLIGNSIEHSLRAQENWRLADLGQGAFTFELTNAGGNVVVALLGWNFSDLNGYYVVLDDDAHESYVVKLSKIGNNGLLRERMDGNMVTGQREYKRAPGVTVDPTFRLLQGTTVKMWVIYSHGVIVVGDGTTPGAGRVVLYMEAEEPKHRDLGREMYHFGFARFGGRWKPAVTVDNVISYRYKLGARIPLPDKPLPIVVGKEVETGTGKMGKATSVTNLAGPLYEPTLSAGARGGGVVAGSMGKPSNGNAPPPTPVRRDNVAWGDRLLRTNGVPPYFGQIGGIGGSRFME